jgi:CheY-like chemotaxis protein
MAIQKILVVDDSAVERYHLTDFLSQQGYSVIEAMDGEDAIVKARSHKPDLVLMDVARMGFKSPEQCRVTLSWNQFLSLCAPLKTVRPTKSGVCVRGRVVI